MALNIDPKRKQYETAVTMEIDVSLLQLIQIFKQRKMIAKALLFRSNLSGSERKLMEDSYEHSNKLIKDALGLN